MLGSFFKVIVFEKVNEMIQKAALLRMGKYEIQVVTMAREAVRKNTLDLISIFQNGCA